MPLYIPFEFKQEFLAAKRQRILETYEGVRSPYEGVENTGKSTAAEAYEVFEGLGRGRARQGDESGLGKLAESVAPEACEGLGSLRNLTNVYGENVPSVRQMVEDAAGVNGMVVTELVPGTAEVKVQELGNASGPIRQRRWLVDCFPCGTWAKANPPTFDPDEEL